MNTPTPGAYVAGVCVALAWNAAFLVRGSAGESFAGGMSSWFAVLVLSTVFGAPLAVGGALAVHVSCRRVGAQWVHVIAAGLIGAGGALLLYPWLVVDGNGLLPVSVGVSAGLGRLALVPSVLRRRSRLASRPPLRVL